MPGTLQHYLCNCTIIGQSGIVAARNVTLTCESIICPITRKSGIVGLATEQLYQKWPMALRVNTLQKCSDWRQISQVAPRYLNKVNNGKQSKSMALIRKFGKFWSG